jgi:cytochrome c-type biogenesis protein CcmF
VTGPIGASALLVALAIAFVGAVLGAVGVRRERPSLVRASYGAAYTNFGLLSIATLAMLFALVTHDFSVSYVAQVGSRSTPLFFTIISLWSALEGSILFWGFVLALFTAIVVWTNRDQPGKTVPYATVTLHVISLFFLILLVGPANPFGVVSPVPADGPGPNPLLQNHPLMAVHPPLLYLGYVGFSVPFAFAVGAMLGGELKSGAWIESTRKWTIASWMFLTAAIVAGMWWSYEVLGWGGYWAWDPVENASFLPWLTATAFMHSVMVQQRRNMLKLWNLNLVAATFVLTILGTFLTRSGVLSSVHAFTQGTIGYYFLTFIALVLVASMALVAGNSQELRSEGQLDSAVSRESVFMLNNLLLTAFTFTVLLGTLFPLVAEAMRGVKVSVGSPFFNRMTMPLAVALVFLMGVGPALPWRRASREQIRRQLLPPTIGGVLVATIAVIVGAREPYAILAYLFGAFALVANFREFWIGARARRKAHGESFPIALGRLIGANRHRYGGYIAHLGVISAAIGIAASAGSKLEHEATLKPGERMNVGAYSFEMRQVWGQEEPHRFAVGADVLVFRNGKEVGLLTPRQNFYATQEQPVPTPSVRTTPASDLYSNLMAFKSDGSDATIKIIVEPLVMWIWLGGGIVCLGAAIALWPRRRAAAVAQAVPVRQAPKRKAKRKLAPASAVSRDRAEVTS